VLKKFNSAQFFEVARIVISVDYLLLPGEKRRSNYICTTPS